jgi:hypothetical protein
MDASAQGLDPASLNLETKAQGATKRSLGAQVMLESDLYEGYRKLESIHPTSYQPTIGPPSWGPTPLPTMAPTKSPLPPVPSDITSSINSGRWYTFYHYSRGGTGGFVQGCSPTTVRDCPGAPGVTIPTDVNTPPWLVTGSSCVKVTWTETWYQDNQFELWVNGRHVATGTKPGNGNDCGENPVTCFNGGRASKGEYLLPPGRQSIQFKIVDVQSTDRGAFKVDSYPCPAGNVNSYLDTGTWFGFETNNLGDATIGQRIPSPWTFYSPCPVEFSIVEKYFSNNKFKVYDNSVLAGTTNVAVADICRDGYIEPDTGCSCLDDLEQCIAYGAAHGTFRLPPGSHSISIQGYPSLVDYGVFKIDTRCPVPTQAPTMMPVKSPTASPVGTAPPFPLPPTDKGDVLKLPTNHPTNMPTKAPTNLPTNAPTNLPTNPPTQRPTNSPTKLPTNSPTKLPTNPPTKAPTSRPTKPPTNAPIIQCPRRETTATFELWDGATNARVSAITNTSTYCLRNNWNIRAVTTHERRSCGRVRIRFYDPLRPNAVVRRNTDSSPPYFLYGDNPATGDVYGNTNRRPRVEGLTLTNNRRYCIRAVTVRASGYSEQCFTHLCR